MKMYAAIDRGDVDAMRQLLEQFPELEKNCPHHGYPTWLHYAAAQGHVPTAAFWLERGWDVNVARSQQGGKINEQLTPLHVAKGVAMTQYLLEQGARVNAQHGMCGTPLHFAVSAADLSQKGRRRESGPELEQLRALIEAGADPSLTSRPERNRIYTPLSWAVYLRRKSAEAYLRSIGAPETIAPPRKARPVKALDLRKEADAVYEFIVKRASAYKPTGRNVLGEAGPVKFVVIGYEYAEDGWVAVVFDQRPDAEVDGEWTSCIESLVLKRARWVEAGEENSEAPLPVIQLDGTPATLPPGTELAVVFGEVIKSAALKARADGVFAVLPTAPGCEFHIEHFSGYWGWPEADADARIDRLRD